MHVAATSGTKHKRSCSIMKLTRSLIAMLTSSLLAGCMVGPNYHRPAVQTPTAYRDLSENPQLQAQAASYADLPWWQVFKDPKLQELIRTALKQNYDLQLATERIVAARAELAITRSNLFPQVQGNGNFSRWTKKLIVQNKVQLSDPHGRRGVPVGFLRPSASRDRGLTRPAAGY